MNNLSILNVHILTQIRKFIGSSLEVHTHKTLGSGGLWKGEQGPEVCGGGGFRYL